MPKVKAIIFNVDGTLIDNERARLAAWKRAGFKVQSVNVNYIWNKTLGLSKEDTRAVFCKVYGYKIYNKFIKLAERYYKPHLALNKGIQTLLDECKKMEIKLAAISSEDSITTKNKLVALGIDSYFDTIITKDECPLTRPFPEPYTLFPQLLHIKLKHIIVFESSENGCISAIRAGYKTIYFYKDTVQLERPLPYVQEFIKEENMFGRNT